MRILLTGAGFSRNWGGWLASEAFEYLLGCNLDQQTRDLLWRSKEEGGGFEDTLADLANAKDADSENRLNDLTTVLVGMFDAMSRGFAQRQTLEFQDQPEKPYMVATFLSKFEAIFTLNQDTLLEQHYFGLFGAGDKWTNCRAPGVKRRDSDEAYRKRHRPRRDGARRQQFHNRPD